MIWANSRFTNAGSRNRSMKTSISTHWRWQVVAAVLFMLVVGVCDAAGSGKFGIHGVHMTPNGQDAERFSESAFGGGAHVMVTLPRPIHMFAGVVGFEAISLHHGITGFPDNETGLLVQQHTRQGYTRFFLGAELGGHGRAFFRPHIGFNFALVYYTYQVTVEIPDDRSSEPAVQQTIDDKGRLVFGQDITLGVDLNFANTFYVDCGVRYLKSYAVPQELGRGAITVHPEYFQMYLGIGFTFDYCRRMAEKNKE